MKNHSIRTVLLVLLLTLCVALSPACLAESSHADDFFSGVSQAWDGLLGMAEDAGKAASDWVNESGVVEWVEGATNDITAWAQGALSDITTWADESGVTEWTQTIESNVRSFIDENGPEVQAWLAGAGEEVRNAWNTLIHADEHDKEEVEAALETVVDALEPAQGE